MCVYSEVSVNKIGTLSNMETIDLNNLQGLPKELLGNLQNYNQLFNENICLENLLNYDSIVTLIEEINEHCLKNRIFGYHFTRAIPAEIQETGLTCRKGEDIRNTFIAKFGHLFTMDEKLKIKEAWTNYFKSPPQKSRDSRLFFNFTTYALVNDGAKPLLTNYGGEQVYKPLEIFEEIGNKIKCIGKPLILRCKLNPNKINTFCENPWGRIAVSTYHRNINREAHQYDQDGYQNVDVDPVDIEIIEYDQNKLPLT